MTGPSEQFDRLRPLVLFGRFTLYLGKPNIEELDGIAAFHQHHGHVTALNAFEFGASANLLDAAKGSHRFAFVPPSNGPQPEPDEPEGEQEPEGEPS